MKIEDLYFAPQDLYRLGNSSSPRLTHVRRPKDISTTEIDGITMVIANRKGVSLFTKEEIENNQMSGWVWKVVIGTRMPIGLKLVNDRPGHYMICPISNIPLEEFIDLLSKLALKCQKVYKKEVM